MIQASKARNAIGDKKSFTVKKFLFYALVIAFFVGVVLAYYNMLYNQTRDSIIKNGQAAAIQSKNYLSEYLSTSIDAIKLTAYTIDGMIRNNRTNKEILDYLTGQSTAVTSTTSTANISTARVGCPTQTLCRPNARGISRRWKAKAK